MRFERATPEEMLSLVPRLDEEFVFGRQRTISLSRRYPGLFLTDRSNNFFLLKADDGSIAASLAFRPLQWREGDVPWAGAMIGMVWTAPEQRGQGLGSELMKRTDVLLQQEGYDFGVLWTGKPGFYQRMGWEAADCGMFGEFGAAGDGECHPFSEKQGVSILSLDDASIELIGQIVSLRGESQLTLEWEDYHALPLPATRTYALLDKKGEGYAIAGENGAKGILYEMGGSPNTFPSLWAALTSRYDSLIINDQRFSTSFAWLSAHTAVVWKSQALALWKRYSARLPEGIFNQCYIPYFHRI